MAGEPGGLEQLVVLVWVSPGWQRWLLAWARAGDWSVLHKLRHSASPGAG